ncbi:hypothetical protein HMPREF0971_01266 [Segatella oris F0302]|uniref:Uncharacterized protein n=1 Tax=Segatella oris F0302 TaxID=649760 RepID=D1QQL5_9BACT|nr:hypothetical protein HMPREF0971_01266 [Segatella oris F0302]
MEKNHENAPYLIQPNSHKKKYVFPLLFQPFPLPLQYKINNVYT